ncbi:hypothetical protein [Vibrio alfacsensis]|uniref:hypothetical protein n=1 Tax=Vibrio alfacsensis TaxID=1074311 RepID=UPI001BEFE18E|nr:hypothetical protein [Vibrio alfacsensis]WQE77643.1 hypothetical protein SO574_17785 [Vibrio alfacsensis]BCN26858.1 hypothetical protein VYA_40500 [Vibrio alfacsensis]
MKKATLILLIVLSMVSGPVNALGQFLDLSKNDFTHAYIDNFSHFYIAPEISTQEDDYFQCLTLSALQNEWPFSYWSYGLFSAPKSTLLFFLNVYPLSCGK